MLDDLWDDDDDFTPGSEDNFDLNPKQTDTFFTGEHREVSSEPEEEQKLDSEDDWLYNDIFSGTKKSGTPSSDNQVPSKWDNKRI